MLTFAPLVRPGISYMPLPPVKQLCAVDCNENGYHFMGLQYSTECWCGSFEDEMKNTQYGEGMCDMPCSGDSSETCGTLMAYLFDINKYCGTP